MTGSRFWISKAEPLVDGDGVAVDATQVAVSRFLDLVIAQLRADERTSCSAAILDGKNGEMALSGVFEASDTRAAQELADEVFSNAIEAAGGEDDSETAALAEWRHHLLSESVKGDRLTVVTLSAA